MAITVVSRPKFPLIGTTAVTASVSNSGGNALFTKTTHGLNTGDYIYIYSARAAYNGFWYVEKIDANTFKVREYSTADLELYVNSGNVTYYAGNGAFSSWNSVHLPLVYKLSSDKFQVNSVDTARSVSSFSNSNGYTRVNLSGDIKASGSADALEQVKISGTPLLDGIYRIISWSSDINFVIDLAYSASNVFTGGTIQYYYGNYHARVKIYAGIPVGHYWQDYKTMDLITEIRVPFDSSNVATFNVSEFVKKKILSIENNTILDTLPNNVDAWCGFYISVAESYDDANQYGTNDLNVTEYVSSYTTDETLYAANTVLPFRNMYSGNLAEYIAQSATNTPSTKWLTGFSEPTLFTGFYFDLSFIIDLATLAGMTIERTNYSAAGAVLSTQSIVLTNMHRGVYRQQFEQSTSGEAYFTVQLSDGAPFGELLRVNINSDCSAQDFYVTWLNYLGGYDYWNFKAESVYGTDILDSRTQEKNIFTDWPKSFGEFADSITKQTKRSSKDNITLNSQQLSNIELDGLSGIVESPLVQQMESIYSKRTLILDASSFPKKQDNQKLLQVTIQAHFTDENPSQRL